MTVEDHPFPYRVSSNAYVAHCHVRIIRRQSGALLIVSELASNGGMSVCNAFEDLLPLIAYAFDLDPDVLIVVEHWGPFSYTATDRGSADRDEEFVRVTYTFDRERPARIGFRYPELARGAFSDPTWTPITQADVEALAGGELPPFPFDEPPEHYGLSPSTEVRR